MPTDQDASKRYDPTEQEYYYGYGCTIVSTGHHLLAKGVVPVAPYNARNAADPKDIEYSVEDRIAEHSEDIHLGQSTLDETFNRRRGVELTS